MLITLQFRMPPLSQAWLAYDSDPPGLLKSFNPQSEIRNPQFTRSLQLQSCNTTQPLTPP